MERIALGGVGARVEILQAVFVFVPAILLALGILVRVTVLTTFLQARFAFVRVVAFQACLVFLLAHRLAIGVLVSAVICARTEVCFALFVVGIGILAQALHSIAVAQNDAVGVLFLEVLGNLEDDAYGGVLTGGRAEKAGTQQERKAVYTSPGLHMQEI
jgi:hypothetical protein